MQSTLSQFETRFDGLENLLAQLLVQGSNTNEKLQEVSIKIHEGYHVANPDIIYRSPLHWSLDGFSESQQYYERCVMLL